MRSKSLLVLVVAIVGVSVTGCSAFRSLTRKSKKKEAATAEPNRAASQRTPDKLDVASVKSVGVQLPEDPVCPGSRVDLEFEVTFSDGTQKKTWTDYRQKAGFINHSEFTVQPAQGKARGRTVTVSSDTRALMKSGAVVTVSLVKRPDMKAEVTLPVSFDCRAGVGFAGRSGATGRRGMSHMTSGRTSTTGRPGKSDSGGNGGPGRAGGPGPKVVADVGYVKLADGRTVILVKAMSDGKVRWAALDANSDKKVTVFAAGGRGGSGGDGGDGRYGYHASGSSNSNPGAPGGSGGNGGAGAAGGKGGQLVVRYDRRFPKLAERIKASAGGGAGGSGGRAGKGGDGGRNEASGATAAKGRTGRSGSPGKSAPAGKVKLQKTSHKKLFAGDRLKLAGP